MNNPIYKTYMKPDISFHFFTMAAILWVAISLSGCLPIPPYEVTMSSDYPEDVWVDYIQFGEKRLPGGYMPNTGQAGISISGLPIPDEAEIVWLTNWMNDKKQQHRRKIKIPKPLPRLIDYQYEFHFTITEKGEVTLEIKH